MKRQRDLRNIRAALFALFILVPCEVMAEAPAMDAPGSVIEVMGLACSGVEYYQDGTPEFCRLARAGTLSGQVFAAATGVHFTKEGSFDWCFLPKDTEIQGILCRGGGHDFMTEFHANGKLKRAYLSENQLIQGIPCARFRFWSALFWPMHGKKGGTDFHDNGRLSACELSEAFAIEGQRIKRGSTARFDYDGKLMTGQ